jgi:hypothetical protein
MNEGIDTNGTTAGCVTMAAFFSYNCGMIFCKAKHSDVPNFPSV